MDRLCPICQSKTSRAKIISGYTYYVCSSCDFFFSPEELSTVTYSKDYWEHERLEALRREKEDCCARALELIFLSKIPVTKFLDFGCGLGVTVNWMRDQLGVDAYGIDKFGQFEPNSKLIKEDILTTTKFEEESFDAIMSVEVVEHLPQSMIIPIFEKLRDLLKPGGMILINSGTLEFTKESIENSGYIDPSIGHISIYSFKTYEKIAERLGLIHIRMWSRNYCTLFLRPKTGIDSRISPWEGLKENFDILKEIPPLYLLVRHGLWAEERNQAVSNPTTFAKEIVVQVRDAAYNKLTHEVQYLREALKSMKSSKSWRLTYPIRWVSAKVKGIKTT